MLCPKIKNLANMRISAQAQHKCKDNIIYNVSTVSDLRGLTGYLRLRRRCFADFAEPRVWRETAMPPVLGKETIRRAASLHALSRLLSCTKTDLSCKRLEALLERGAGKVSSSIGVLRLAALARDDRRNCLLEAKS